MQIITESLALAAFGDLLRRTSEPHRPHDLGKFLDEPDLLFG